MVMPSIPMLLSASFTSSSLKGLMIASIFFIMSSTLRLHDVAFFAVHAQIEALDLLIFLDPKPKRRIADLQNDKCSHDRQRPRDRHTDDLVHDLAAVPIHQPQRRRLARRILQSIVDRVGGKHP